ncbi:MAG: response regulator [Desulfobacteraceae bacterium]|nr:response regulator [Desulfobacteraceae bacterium]
MSTAQILVVDDEKRIVDNISFYLKREGFETTGVYGGEAALATLSQKKFDLVLLDISMPRMSGFEVMERIFGLDKDVLVIIVTGYATVESAIKALKLGAWDYLKKPFEYTDLIKTVKNAISQKRLLDDKKEVSARLEASEKQYEYMVNNSPDLVFTLDQKGRFCFINDQFERLLGFKKKALLYRNIREILHEDDILKASVLFDINEIKKGGNKSVRIDLRFKKANKTQVNYNPYGAHVFVELKASAMHLPASGKRDEFKGVYVVARDVTERIYLEDQLRQAQKMEAIGTLAGGIAHDFNNILMGIQGYSSLVKTSFAHDSEEFERLSNIDEYVFSGAEMARQLLGFAQKSGHEPCKINLNYLLKMSAKMFGRTKKEILIEQHLEKHLWSTVVDEGQIKQVLMNLFVNAWQAMPEGGKIIIKSENIVVNDAKIGELGLESPGNYVKVTVTDTGMGIDEGITSRIFDPFFTTKERGKGTGLGLATAYGIIKSHKGTFRIESKIGFGSSFMFFLPAQEELVKSQIQIEDKSQIFNGKGSILIIDDERGFIEVCSEMLETLGYETLAADNGQDAVEIVQKTKKKIDLAILDMIMPKMNGSATFDAIRKHDSEIKVLMVSGYSKKDAIEEMINKGCCGFLFKPFDISVLSEKLKTIFKDLERV